MIAAPTSPQLVRQWFTRALHFAVRGGLVNANKGGEMKRLKTTLAAMALAGGLAFGNAPAAAQSFDPGDQAQDRYVQGNLLFLTYHEVGHLLMDLLLEMDQHQDRLGAEETADDISTWLMLPDPDEPDQDEEILAAMQGWLDSSDAQEAPSQSPHYPDDATRAARIACYLYGSNPGRYADLGRAFRNSVASANCSEEYEALDADLEDWFGDSLIPPADPNGGQIHVHYETAPANLSAAQAYLAETGILEDAAEDISQFVHLPSDVTLVARRCGAGGAEFRYSPSARQITACYEAVAWFMGDAPDEVSERAQAGGDDLGSGGARVVRRPRQPTRPRGR